MMPWRRAALRTVSSARTVNCLPLARMVTLKSGMGNDIENKHDNPKRYGAIADDFQPMNWKRVLVANDPLQAGMAKVALEASGLSVQLRQMELWGVAVEVLYSQGAAPSVWVPAHQEQTAMRILSEQFAADQNMDEPDWRCAHCNEFNGSRFAACWQCGNECQASNPADLKEPT